MLSEEQIRQTLHASRVVPLAVAKPHGPLGLDQLAETTAQTTARHVTASRLAAAIIEQFVATLPQRNEMQE